jgi:hypothetical protein
MMLMKTVGEYYLKETFSPVSGSREMDSFLDTDISTEPQARQFIRSVLLPHFEMIETEGQTLIKESLRYYLTTGFDYGRFWASLGVSFPLPTDKRQFFLRVWDELFPGESSVALDLAEYVEEASVVSQERIKYRP